ncbi:MAG TPA: SRPBCC domain-containing protein [Solirubrobacterales bacterium]|nr:SRPBCC domain-containing protein [Solirubrobacterales bacterium]
MSTLAQTVERAILLDAEPREVWEAITDEALLSEWLADRVELEPRQGGGVRCRYADGEERRGEVELVEEAERLAFHWRRQGGGPSRVEFIVDAVAEGTRLRVIETGLAEPTAPTTLAAGWGPRLSSLRLLLGRLVLA